MTCSPSFDEISISRLNSHEELDDGHRPEHTTPVERVVETNWFFRLSRHGDRLVELIENKELPIDPAPFRNEILAFRRAGVRDISLSRSTTALRDAILDAGASQFMTIQHT